MLEFQKLTIDNIKTLLPYFIREGSKLCEYTLGVKWMWREYFNTVFTIYQDTLIICEQYENEQCCFYYPLGSNIEAAFSMIDQYVTKMGYHWEFCCLDENQAKKIKKRYPDADIQYDRKWSDYLYYYHDFTDFKGKKYAGQRNHVNKFCKLYPNHRFVKAQLEDIKRIQLFLANLGTKTKGSAEAIHEAKQAYQMIEDCFVLDLPCYYLEIDNEIAGFTIGEIVNDILFVHVEKTDHRYAGINPFLIQSFVNVFNKRKMVYINREDDCGDIGLRTTKLQYHPIKIMHKYFIRQATKKVIVETERLLVREIMPQDKKAYYTLNIDPIVNEFWGYDFRVDVFDDAIVNEQYFYDVAVADYINKEALSYIICLKESGDLIGEIVLHHMTDKEVEVGIRLLKSAQGKGYAKEVLPEIIKYCHEVLKRKVLAKCYKVNKASYRLLSKLFEKTRKDECYYYFEKTDVK